MSKLTKVQSLFLDAFAWVEQERNDAEKLVGKLPPQDPACVRSYVLKEVGERLDKLGIRVVEILETPDA